MPKSQIDATALLAVLIASALALLLPASFAWLSCIAGVALVFVLLSFDREGYRSAFQSLAFAAVFGICIDVAGYQPLQVLASGGKLHAGADARVPGEWLPLLWVCATLIFWGIDRGRMSGRESFAGETARPAVSGQRTFIPEPVQLVRRQAEPAPAPEEAPPAPAATPAPAPSPAPAPVAARRSGKETMIYVTLLGEGLNVLRSVRAEHLGRDFYQIVDVMPEGETWEYRPGQIVRCKKKNLSSGKAWVAVEEAPRAS